MDESKNLATLTFHQPPVTWTLLEWEHMMRALHTLANELSKHEHLDTTVVKLGHPL